MFAIIGGQALSALAVVAGGVFTTVSQMKTLITCWNTGALKEINDTLF